MRRITALPRGEGDEPPVLAAAAGVGAMGVGVGLLVGALRRGWKWTPVDTDELVARIAPRTGGLEFGLRLTP